MKVVFLLFGLLFALLLGIMFFQNNQKNLNIKIPFSKSSPTATINKQAFTLLVAKTPKETQIGLSDKTSLPEKEGMIFIFEKADQYSFWMKNMKFPLDIIYIRDNKIVTIIENAQPPKNKDDNPPILRPDEPADKVLEINSGLSKKYGFKKGDEITIKGL